MAKVYPTPDQDGEVFELRYHNREQVVVEGTLRELSATYRDFCESRTDIRHGPATLRLRGDEAGFINARGEVYLHQLAHRRVI